jgi:osmotically-inducible protein OsmY
MSFNRQVAFGSTAQSGPQVDAELSPRITQMANGRVDSPISVTVSGGTATVRGVAKTPYDRLVVGAMVLMEPGIRTVNNELTVQSQPALAQDVRSR